MIMFLNSNKNRRLLLVGLLVLILSLCLPVAALPLGAAEGTPRASDTATSMPVRSEQEDAAPFPSDASDYSNPNSEALVELSASAYVARLVGAGVTLPAAEITFLDNMLADAPFRYNNAIPPRALEVTYEHNTLTVIASPHSYTAVNGETVLWKPVSGTLGNRTLPLKPIGEDGVMQCVIPDLPESAAARLEIQYACTITVPAAVSDAYINYAWTHADRLVSEQTAYEAQKAAYEAYGVYLTEKAKYDLALSTWQTYLAAKEKYDRLYADYLAYEQNLKLYHERLAAYEAYTQALKDYEQKQAAYDAAYAVYVAEKNAYDAALPLYETNRAEINTATDILASLDSAFVRNSRGKQMYATLIGDTVATVVNRKDELVSVGKCDPKDIDTADRSTAVLQDLLTQYQALDTLYDRFTFYQAHYQEIRQNFSALYGSLRSLYRNDVVKSTLINKGKLERYIEFLCQLYVISSGLDDAQNRAAPEDWVIYGRYDNANYEYITHTYTTDLEPIQIPPDKNNADPTGVHCPSVTVPEPTKPILSAEKPVRPEEVTYPVEPDAVIKPSEPPIVTRPGPAPTPVEDPGDAPIAPAHTALQQALMEAKKDGTLRRRSEGEDKKLAFSTSLSRLLSLQNKRPVEFYDYNGQDLLYSTELEDGTPIEYGGEPPFRPDSDRYSYRFVGWKDQDGQLLSELGVVDGQPKYFFASYEATPRIYNVTWIVDGVETVEPLPYGAKPHFSSLPSRDSTAQYDYIFTGWRIPGEDGWSTVLSAVRKDVTYEAVFEPVTRRYTVTWVYGEGDSASAVWDYGALPTPDKTPVRPENDRYLYAFTGWDTEPAPVTGNVTYTAVYAAIPILPVPAPDDEPTAPQVPVLKEETYLATIPSAGLQVDRLFDLALLRDRTVSLTSEDGLVSLYFNNAVLVDLDASGCTYICIQSAENAPPRSGRIQAKNGIAVRFLDAERRELALSYPVTLRFSGANAFTRVYAETADAPGAPFALPFTSEGEELTVKLNRSMTLYFIGEYPLTLAPCENGILSADRSTAFAGDTVTFSLTYTDDYLVDSLRVVGAEGREYPLERTSDGRYTLVMPDEPVTVEASLARKTYTVIFQVDDVILSKEVYYKGDTVKVPEDPTKESVGKIVYTFIGWTPHITVVTEDVVYTATFRESEQSNSQTYIPVDSHNREYLLYIEVGLLLALLIATPIVIVTLVKRRRKKKRAAEQVLPVPTTSTESSSDSSSDS